MQYSILLHVLTTTLLLRGRSFATNLAARLLLVQLDHCYLQLACVSISFVWKKSTLIPMMHHFCNVTGRCHGICGSLGVEATSNCVDIKSPSS